MKHQNYPQDEIENNHEILIETSKKYFYPYPKPLTTSESKNDQIKSDDSYEEGICGDEQIETHTQVINRDLKEKANIFLNLDHKKGYMYSGKVKIDDKTELLKDQCLDSSSLYENRNEEPNYKHKCHKEEIEYYKNIIKEYEKIIAEKSDLIGILTKLVYNKFDITEQHLHKNMHVCDQKDHMNGNRHDKILEENIHKDLSLSKNNGRKENTDIFDHKITTDNIPTKTPGMVCQNNMKSIYQITNNLFFGEKQIGDFKSTILDEEKKKISTKTSLYKHAEANKNNFNGLPDQNADYLPFLDENTQKMNAKNVCYSIKEDSDSSDVFITDRKDHEIFINRDIDFDSINNCIEKICENVITNKKEKFNVSASIVNELTCETKNSYFEDISDSSSIDEDKIQVVDNRQIVNKLTIKNLSQKKKATDENFSKCVKKIPKRFQKGLHTKKIEFGYKKQKKLDSQKEKFKKLYSLTPDSIHHKDFLESDVICQMVKESENKTHNAMICVSESQSYNIKAIDAGYAQFVEKISKMLEKTKILSPNSKTTSTFAVHAENFFKNLNDTERNKLDYKSELAMGLNRNNDIKLTQSIMHNNRTTDFSIEKCIYDFDINNFDLSFIKSQNFVLCKKFNLKDYNKKALKQNFITAEEEKMFKFCNEALKCPFLAFFYVKILFTYRNRYVNPMEMRNTLWKSGSSESNINKRPARRIWYASLVLFAFYGLGDFAENGDFGLRKICLK